MNSLPENTHLRGTWLVWIWSNKLNCCLFNLSKATKYKHNNGEVRQTVILPLKLILSVSINKVVLVESTHLQSIPIFTGTFKVAFACCNCIVADVENFYLCSRFRSRPTASSVNEPLMNQHQESRTRFYWHGDNVINKFHHCVTMLCWNKALWLDVASHATNFSQSECFISEYSSYAEICFWHRLPNVTSESITECVICTNLIYRDFSNFWTLVEGPSCCRQSTWPPIVLF